ncbi:hypothetical protein EAW52_25275 [Pseudomonas sp. LTJR-52]|uniref:hypothetical protein n=1 Tax=Pseudomonas sp. LTJR-52 TaxID=2479392 RepID=UPI000EFBB036|nr:hypothetical protein [Pseudomonas sp. LTJR-52]AYN97002.1 hypothetical protein EAW52_25275 [Pseudomonas sp. LTJR-52]
MNLSFGKRKKLSQDLRNVGVAGISIGIIRPLFMTQLAEIGLGSYWISGLALALGLVAWIAGLALTPSAKEA